MAEESEGKFHSEKALSKHNQDPQKPGKGWIICQSHKRPGRLYDFNTITGETVWRDPDAITHHSAIMDKNKIQFYCHEPTDPPLDTMPYHHHNTTPSSSATKIYNKQIINNQLPANVNTLDHFGNAVGAPYRLLNSNNAIAMGAPQVWVTAPAPPVLIGPSVAPLNQLPIICGDLEKIHLQNSSVTLSNRFQVLNQMSKERPFGSDMLDGVGGDRSSTNCNRLPPRQGWNVVNRHINKKKDLRSLLSSRRRQDLRNDAEDIPVIKEDVSARVTEDDLNPDDNDEWLEAHTHGEGKKLNIDVGSIWDLADSGASRDCWYIIPTIKALLNNMRFLTSLLISDERLRLLAPRDVVRALRSAAFSGDGRLADCASRARTFVIRQMSKIPNRLKDAANLKSCQELIGPNTYVVILVDEKDTPNKQITSCLQITAANIKRHLESAMSSKPKMVSKMQNVIDNIKKVVTNDEAKGDAESIPRCKPTATTTSQSAATVNNRLKEQDLINTDKARFKVANIQTDLTTPPPKLTANAYVQTDFVFTFTNSAIKPKEMNITQVPDAAKASNDSRATKAPTRKILLKRQQCTNTGSKANEKKIRWRKRNVTALTSKETSSQQNSNKSCLRGSSPPPSSTSNLAAQQNDNAIDSGYSDFSAHAKVVDEPSSSAGISDSIDSETGLKLNKKTILSESKTDQKEEMVMYEITSDCMEDRLSMRCDEWVSRFVQIMEEVLSQVLQLDPPFMDSALPPPWSLQEATVCIKRKLKQHNIIVDASDKLDGYLMKINYDRGNIGTHISPTDFMLLYTYGLNLVNKLQLVQKNCEDLHIASQNLSKLLCDIREPSLDESDEMENLNCDDPMNSPNISEVVTIVSTAEVQESTAPTVEKSPQKGREHILSCNNSPARYSLRSSRSAEKGKERKPEALAADYTLFASLGLQKNKFVPEKCIAKTILNPKVQNHQTSPAKALDSVLDVQENNAAQAEPKIIRNFSKCPKIEKKLRGINCANTDEQNDGDYAHGADNNAASDYVTDDNATGDYVTVDNATGDHVTDDNVAGDHVADDNAAGDNVADDNAAGDNVADDNAAGDNVTDDNIDIEKEGTANTEPHKDDNCSDLLRTAMDNDQKFESKKPGDLNANKTLKLVTQITTSKYRKWLQELYKFCELTKAALESKDRNLTKDQINTMKKTTQVREHAKNVCSRLKSILNRDPCVTRQKFRDLMKGCGIQDFDLNEAQLAEYRGVVEKYLEVAEQASMCVASLAGAVKVRKYRN